MDGQPGLPLFMLPILTHPQHKVGVLEVLLADPPSESRWDLLAVWSGERFVLSRMAAGSEEAESDDCGLSLVPCSACRCFDLMVGQHHNLLLGTNKLIRPAGADLIYRALANRLQPVSKYTVQDQIRPFRFFYHSFFITFVATAVMGLGVLEDKHLDNVPGTATIADLDELNVAQRTTTGVVKYSRSGIILVPQPSDDPNDPLNLPLWRRDLITGILCLWSVIASTLSPLLAADSITLLFYYDRPTTFTDIALLTGYHLLGVGVAGFIFVASARVWGKRHLYLLGTITIIWSSAWGGATGQNYNSLIAARFFQGIGLAPFEALVNASVGDLYFVHERGLRMAISNLCLFGGAFFTPVIVGVIAKNMGWQWTFYFVAIFGAALLPLVVLLVPETAFKRDGRFDVDRVKHERAGADIPPSSEATTPPPSYKDIDSQEPSRTSPASSKILAGDVYSDKPGELSNAPESEYQRVIHEPIRTPIISRRSLAIFTGRKTDEPFVKLLLRPFPLFFHPSILWAMLIQGAIIGWTVFIGIVLAAIYFGPPLLFTEEQTGFMYTGAFVGALIGFGLSGLLSYVPVLMAQRNNGVYEPEFRMILVIPQLILGCTGLYGFGITAENVEQYGWIVPDVFFALEVAGMVLGAVASALYIVDAHRDIAVEAFTCLLIFKNIFSFGLTFSGYDWMSSGDIKPVFEAIASVQVVICCLTIPMCK